MTIRQTIVVLFIGWTFGDCNSPNEFLSKKFFEYDEIDYYLSDSYMGSESQKLLNNWPTSEIDTLKYGVFLGGIPKNISDLSFIGKLSEIGFRKDTIDKKKFTEIDKFFVEKEVKEHLATSCIYIYRDILVFKKNSKVTGVAKICFSCMAHEIIGTNANTDNFGQDGDYEKLENLLKK